MADEKQTTGTQRKREEVSRKHFIAALRATDCSFNTATLVAMTHAAADEIERVCEMRDEAEAAYEAVWAERVENQNG